MKERFLVTDTVPDDFCDAIRAAGYEADYIPVLYNDGLAPIIDRYEGIVVSSHVTLDREMLALASRLKYILRPGSGLDNIDVKEAEARGIKVLNSPEANSHAVAEHAIGLILGLLTYIPRAAAQVKRLQWERHGNTGQQFMGMTVGVIGYGNTGSALVQKLQGFGVEVLIYDKHKSGYAPAWAKESSWEEIKQRADVLSLHIPLDRETHHLVDDDLIASFAKPIYLINTSRGKIVDSAAVAKALATGRLRGAGLDVLENERIAKYSNEEKAALEKLLNAGNIIVTPHIAGWTREARRDIFFKVLEKFMAWKGTVS